MSGFTLAAIVGPRELYGSRASFDWQIAPTAIALGELAGSLTLPAGTWKSTGPTTPSTNRSKRGVAVALNLWMIA